MLKLPLPPKVKECCVTYLFDSSSERFLNEATFANIHNQVMGTLKNRYGVTSYGSDGISYDIFERFGFEVVFEIHFKGYMGEGTDIEIVLEYNLNGYSEDFDQIWGLTYDGENKYFNV